VRVVAELARALQPTDIVIGGGNVRLLDAMPPGCRPGDNSHAFIGGLRLWEDAGGAASGAPVDVRESAAVPGPAAKDDRAAAERKSARRASTRKRRSERAAA
jgi:polyphosphate glucokinase